MTPRRLLLAILVVTGRCGARSSAMVRYTRRVEHDLTHASAAGTTLRFLKERVEVPAFAAADLSGRQISTAEFKNKVILVNFWATWCPPCREEIPDLIALQDKYRDQLQIIGVSQDSGSPEQVARFAAGPPHELSGRDEHAGDRAPLSQRLRAADVVLHRSWTHRIAQKHVGLLNPSLTEIETRSLAGLPVDARVELVDDEDKVRLANAAQANKIPGIDLSPLTGEKRPRRCSSSTPSTARAAAASRWRSAASTIPTCNVSLPTAQAIVKKIAEQ